MVNTKKIVKNFSKSAASLTDYVVPPNILANDNSDNRLHIRVGRELNIDFEGDWVSTVTDKEIIKILK